MRAGGIHPFSQIEVGKVHLHLTADGRSATLQLVTHPPTVCAIAYGETGSLGSIADDPNMGGTAVSRHTVVLGGLVPGTTYYFRLTAIDASGRVFQSRKLASFKTPRGPGAREHDVATGAKVLAASSQWSGTYGASNAVDGNLSTEWASNGNGNRAFVTIQLKRQYKIRGVAFITRQMADGSAITRTFAVVVGGRRYGPFPTGNPLDLRIARVRFRARVLRFEVVTSTGGNTGADEIEVLSPT
jgi:F5/8 type C domain